jgi:outer membrane protein OmpA-like peptidoglycan-associated protein
MNQREGTKMNQRSPLALAATAVMTGAALLLFAPFAHAADAATSGHDPLPAQAGELSLKLEPGFAFPLTHPQSRLFDLGGSGTIKALYSLNGYLDVGPSMTFLALATDTSGGESGRAWAYGATLRVKRPHTAPDDDMAFAISPWADADALYVRTGPLNRFGFAVAAGLAVPIGSARSFWVGPFVRYFQIVQEPTRSGFDNRDAKLLSIGVSLEVGPGVRRPAEAVAAACPDRDGDGVCDAADLCPDVAGPPENWGCPPYKRLVVKADKLELKEKLYFAWDQAVIEDISFPVLDEVVQALKDNKSFEVQVQGHASSEGTDDHNQTLSEKRAEAVLDYLVAHGIAKGRLASEGFSSSVPAQTNTTEAGREANRRVEFVVHFVILKKDGGK